MHRKIPEWHKLLKCQRTLYIRDTYRRGLNCTVSLYDQPFSRYKVVENRKCPEWPQNDLKQLTFKSTLHTPNTNPRGPSFTPFRSTIARFPDNRGFWFLKAIVVNLIFLKTKSLKIRNPKFQKSQVHFCEDHWEENSGQVWKLSAEICRRSSILKFHFHWIPC